MRSIFDPAAAGELRDRIDSLTPDADALWGRMDGGRMLCHLADSFRVPLREGGEAAFRPSPLAWPPVRFLVAHLLPLPKAKIHTAPEYQAASVTEWGADREALHAALDRFLARGGKPDPDWGVHPAFGRMSTRQWGWLSYKHCDHHLRQFGV